MSQDDVEVYYQDDEWRVGVPRGTDPISRHQSQDEAVEAGRSEAERLGVQLIVRDPQGTITDRDA
jgi:hypothetical protein